MVDTGMARQVIGIAEDPVSRSTPAEVHQGTSDETAPPTRVAVFGSTGSIGSNALAVIAAAPSRLQVVALSTHSRVEEIALQAAKFRPRWLVITSPSDASRLDRSRVPPETEILIGPDALLRLAEAEEVDVVVAAIVGIAGLPATWAALEAGKRVALANKETLVAAGPLIMELTAQRGGQILPVDSEHSAIFQALAAGRRQDLRRIVLTASGGPFRSASIQEMQQVTIEQALLHPTWQMGKKISIDSATMMNKALEIIEARWLFDVLPEKIEVVIHPQSIVHSFVEFIDGSLIAQMGPTDMKLPIQYALSYPARWPAPVTPWDFARGFTLEFEPPDPVRFPALALGQEVAAAGGTSGVVLNAANEAAVERFLGGQLGYAEIVPACRAILRQHSFDSHPTLSQIMALNDWARREVQRWNCH